jgi:hypothetical protein
MHGTNIKPDKVDITEAGCNYLRLGSRCKFSKTAITREVLYKAGIYKYQSGRLNFYSRRFAVGRGGGGGTRWGGSWGPGRKTGTSRDRLPMMSLEFFIDIFLSDAIWY